MRMLADVGCTVEFERPASERFDVVVINTCGFISDAKEESIETILQWGEAKADGLVGQLFVMGCLSERYREELPREIREVDRWFGKTDWPEIARTLARRSPACAKYDRVVTTPTHHAYLKISEGCNRFCAFCAIPLITGRHTSRPIEEIVAEVEMLVKRGVREFNVIAQELTYYGIDLYGQRRLVELIRAISAVDGVKWIRLHYAYPADFPEELLDEMAANDKVCKYLDIALQHVSDRVLANMKRHIDGEQTRRLLVKIREKVPGIHLRTTLMVGFPGEEEGDFEELLEFVSQQRFERMGAFAYCEEDDTYAAKNFDDVISDEVKQRRLERLMELQEGISQSIQESKIGSVMEVVVDREETEYYVSRSQYDSPEVDPEILIKKTRKLQPGQFYNVKVLEALPFELIAEVI